MDSFEAMRRLATTLGVSAPESNEDVFNVSFINSINRSAKRVFKGNVEINAYLEDGERTISTLSTACVNLQKSYNKQHDYYKDIFISLVKVERENEKLLSEINK